MRAASASIRLAESTDIAPIEAEAHAAASVAALRAGRTADAILAARTAFDAVSRSRESLALARTRRAFLSRRSDIALALVAALLADGSEDACSEAFDALDRARSLAISDALERSRARDPAAAERLRALTRAIDPLRPSEGVVAEAARAERAQEFERLEHEVRESHLRGARGAASPRATARVIGCPAVAFAAVGGAIHAIARLPDGSTRAAPVCADRRELERLVDAYLFQIHRGLGAGARNARMLASAHAAERALAEAVFAPVERMLGLSGGSAREQTVVMLPGPLLAGVPLAAIAPGPLRVAVAPSLAVAAMLDEPAPHASAGSLVVSVADERAPAIAAEGSAVAALLGSRGECVHLDGSAATIAAVHQALARAARAHIACHGIFPADAPNLAGLRLADGWYSARDAHALDRAPAELVLSGCATGTSSDQDGEEWFGLVRGFAAAGTRRIVASLWQVDDAATHGLMQEAYRDPAGATLGVLRASKTLREHGAHPATASAFAIFGGSSAFQPEPCVSSNRGLA
jgi:CHAT domain-containing protein